jgi:hypothetical protein
MWYHECECIRRDRGRSPAEEEAMHRHILVGFVCAIVIVGCGARTPVVPDVGGPSVTPVAQTQPVYDERYRLWGEYTWYIPETHDRVDVVPRRSSQVHVNVLKWLEVDCPDCLRITNVKNNGDSTIDVTVQIRHPKPGHPELTGFDVKGIIMFNGSYELRPIEGCEPYPDNFRISWREKGDPELLNPDGYTIRWSPTYDSGSSSPLLSYWPGKYSNGTPTANVNAYIDFYTSEERHMFTHYGIATRVYHIYLPPGPLTAGYAVEACWMPPTNTPVTDPLNDFPISANQDEPYYLRYEVNNNEPITQMDCCGWDHSDPCKDLRTDVLQWSDPIVNTLAWSRPGWIIGGAALDPCWGSHLESLNGATWYFSDYADGNYRSVARVLHDSDWPKHIRSKVAYTVFDWTVDKE